MRQQRSIVGLLPGMVPGAPLRNLLLAYCYLVGLLLSAQVLFP
jgi:hypothetical protein